MPLYLACLLWHLSSRQMHKRRAQGSRWVTVVQGACDTWGQVRKIKTLVRRKPTLIS